MSYFALDGETADSLIKGIHVAALAPCCPIILAHPK